jgi:hypothetical protein
MNRQVFSAIPTLVLLGVVAHAAAAPLDPARVGWREVELGASKFLMSASARISLSEPKRADAMAGLRQPPEGVAVPAGPRLLQMRYAANLAGQRTDMTLLLDPLSAAALQFELRDSGRRHRERIWRYTDVGAFHWTAKPANDKERALPPARWTERSSGLRRYPPESGSGAVTDATALIYAIAAANYAKPGDAIALRVFSRRRMHEVRAEYVSATAVNADFRQLAGAGESRRKGKVPAWRIVVSGTTVAEPGGDDDDRFTLLGLTDGIELALDPVTRLPLQLTGDAPIVGRVTFRLKSATLRAGAADG